jgi:hypothetical protein
MNVEPRNDLSASDWTLIVWEYHSRQRLRLRGIEQSSFIPSPNRRLPGCEDTPKGRFLVLRNVDRELMKMSEKTVNRITSELARANQVTGDGSEARGEYINQLEESE